jgi:hypothetical protein
MEVFWVASDKHPLRGPVIRVSDPNSVLELGLYFLKE